MRKFILMLALVAFVGLQGVFAQTSVSGTVTSSDDGGTLPGVSVVIEGTNLGTTTDMDGKFSLSVPSDATALVFSFVGMETQTVAFTGQSIINVVMKSSATNLDEFVVTALGISREKKTLTYAAQDVKAEDLNITQDVNIKTAIAGKVAGVQIQSQAGSKLGQSGKIRIRGAISMTADSDPLYVIDGVPTSDPNSIDMENVASVNVLKGPNATALYGQRAEFGVVVITTKKTDKKFSVEVNSAMTVDKVAYLPNYQNLYGGGYEGDASFDTFHFNDSPNYDPAWSALDGMRHLVWDNNYADESWGPKFDDQPYVPWYAWWPGTTENPNPYYGKTANYSAQPDNIKNFYDAGVTMKNSVSIGGSGDNYDARFAYTNINQNGILPYSTLDKNMFNASVNYKLSEKFSFGTNVNYAVQSVSGDFDDGYGNQTTGSFNSWFNRNLDTDIMKELKDLQTTQGYHASWNWWGPNYYTFGGGFEKPAFWYNPYTWLENYVNVNDRTTLIGSAFMDYKINDNFSANVTASTNSVNYDSRYEMPSILSRSAAPELYNSWVNGFGIYNSASVENNFSAKVSYKKSFEDFDVNAFVGGNIRTNSYDRVSTQMPVGVKTGGLILPDVYLFSNASKLPATSTYSSTKQVNSLYGNVSVGYKSMIYLDASYRNDWSSALPAANNGYGYPSVGASFIFTELMEKNDILSFGKIRAGWAQVGNDLSAYLINPVYPISSNTLTLSDGTTTAPMYTINSQVDPNLRPAINTSAELGFDLQFFENRLGLNFTYYNELRKDEIIPVSLSYATGYTTSLINAGESERSGIEVVLTGTPVKTSDFTWDIIANYAKNNTKINKLPAGLDAMQAPGGTGAFSFVSMYHYLGDNWGQIRGAAIARDDNGNAIINASGLYVTKPGQYLGSVLPDFTGGIVNNFTYKGIRLNAAIDFQKGGKFFSLTEMWGEYSGLLAETAAVNDKGVNVRDAVADGGGVHVTGVDVDGNPVDMYTEAHSYYSQWYSNKLAEPFIHDASYIKLRELGLSYQLPSKYFAKNFVSSVSLGLVARNVWLIAVSKDNVHKWDPSELSHTYGENAQLPGTRSFGFNLKLTF